MVFGLIISLSLLGSVGSVALAGLFLLFPGKVRQVFIPNLIGYATGTLLGAAFLGLLPQALNLIPASSALNTVLLGIVLCTLPGALLTYWFFNGVGQALPYIMALSASSFIYIAIADLVPTLHHYASLKSSTGQLALLLGGIGTIAWFLLD